MKNICYSQFGFWDISKKKKSSDIVMQNENDRKPPER